MLRTWRPEKLPSIPTHWCSGLSLLSSNALPLRYHCNKHSSSTWKNKIVIATTGNSRLLQLCGLEHQVLLRRCPTALASPRSLRASAWASLGLCSAMELGGLPRAAKREALLRATALRLNKEVGVCMASIEGGCSSHCHTPHSPKNGSWASHTGSPTCQGTH